MWGMIAGAAAGAIKNQADENEFHRKGDLASATTRFSPWTHMHGEIGDRPSAIGSIMQGAAAGGSMGLGGAAGGGGLGVGPAQATTGPDAVKKSKGMFGDDGGSMMG